jgi:hypothetical protein
VLASVLWPENSAPATLAASSTRSGARFGNISETTSCLNIANMGKVVRDAQFLVAVWLAPW